MALFVQLLVVFTCLLGRIQIAITTGTNYDPHRWQISYNKTATLSSTYGTLVASYAVDGDFKNKDSPFTYAATTSAINPYLQIDLVNPSMIYTIQISVPILTGLSSKYYDLLLSTGNDVVIDSAANHKYSFSMDMYFRRTVGPRKFRYIAIKSKARDARVLRITEVAAYYVPIVSAAFLKNVAYSSIASPGNEKKLVDGSEYSNMGTNYEKNPWLRIDLDVTHFIHEVLLIANGGCCHWQQLKDFEMRIGDSLDKNGNNNPLCFFGTVWTAGLRSVYCDMFGRYVNLIRLAHYTYIQVSEVVINPETTENIAALKTAYTNTQAKTSYYNGMRLTDNTLKRCYIPKPINQAKRVWVILGAEYNIAMIHIINSPDNMENLQSFKISVAMSNVYSSGVLCVPGLQDMSTAHAASFYCEPDRITGNHVHIFKTVADATVMGICEIAIFEETKPEIVDLQTNRYVWLKEGEDITLDCEAKGYPAPVITWVKDNVVIKSGSSTLQLVNLKSNGSVAYECWANNTHGVDARLYTLKVTSELRVCVGFSEIKYQLDQSNGKEIKLEGHQWYKFYDPKQYKELQFRMGIPGSYVPSCAIWMKGSHPNFKDGVVSRSLCIKNETDECSTEHEIFVRRCAQYYVYNFRKLLDFSSQNLCLKNAITKDEFAPAITSATRQHSLSGKTFHTEENLHESHECLMLCLLEKKCKSFNFSQKLQICELNSGTKKEFPRNLVSNLDYDYYQFGKGMLKVSRQDL